MKILLARTAGFCMGVRRAMEIAGAAVRGAPPPIRSHGPLIHNAQAMEVLAARGVRPLGEGEAPEAGTVIVRAHGITREERERLAACGATLADATCPHVLASQRAIEKAAAAGRGVILVGDRDHPEVRGLASHAGPSLRVVGSEEEARAVPLGDAPLVIGQTTFSRSGYEAIGRILRERAPGAEVRDSICDATARRQEEARALARRADALVVVGGRHSANTRRLVEIGREEGKPAFLVETADDLAPADFSPDQTVAVTAGASTPGWLTQEVIERLQTFGGGRFGAAWRRTLAFLARGRFLTALGAAGLCHAVGRLMTGTPPEWTVPLLVACYVFVAHTFNRRLPPRTPQCDFLPVDRFYQEHRATMRMLAFLAAAVCLLLAWRHGMRELLLMTGAVAAAILYGVPLLPGRFRQRRLRDIPASKDTLVAAAWAIVLVGTVTLTAPETMGWKRILGTGGIVFLLVYAMAVMLDLRDIEGDHLIGMETLPILIGRRPAVRLMILVLAGLFVLCLFLGWSGLTGPFVHAFSLVPVYGAVALHRLSKAGFRGEVQCQVAVDGQLLFAGALSLLWGGGS